MRKLLALMVLFCGAASADAAETKKWCSDTGLHMLIEESDGMVLKTPGLQDEPIPQWTDTPGRFFIADGDEEEQLVHIVHDRIFWPCFADAAKMQTWCSGSGGTFITQSGANFMLEGNPVEVDAEVGADGTVVRQLFHFDRDVFFPCLAINKIMMIKDQAVEVTVIEPRDIDETKLRELAQKAWGSVNKEIAIGRMTVKVRALAQEEAARRVQKERKAREEAAKEAARKAREEAAEARKEAARKVARWAQDMS